MRLLYLLSFLAIMFTIREVDANVVSQKPKGVKNEKKKHCTPGDALEGVVQPSSTPFSAKALIEELGVDEEHYILGIDEAGRGPVIGPMVYTGAVIQLKEHDALVQCGVADSKQIDETRRNVCLTKMRTNLKSFADFTYVISPSDIAQDMLGTRGRTLNTLSHETAIKIIVDATLKLCGKLCAVFVDTVGSPESYCTKLQGRFPHLHVVVRSKADALFPVVSAASIVAKVSRDREIKLINTRIHQRKTQRGQHESDKDGAKDGGEKEKDEEERKGETKTEEVQKEHSTSVESEGCGSGKETKLCPDYVGCGYPSDPRTMAYVRSHIHRFFVHSRDDDYIRPSWAPVSALANNEEVCIPVLFEEDARRETEMKQDGCLRRFKYEETAACRANSGMSGQKKINFKEPPQPPSRHPLLKSLKMKPHFPSTEDLP